MVVCIDAKGFITDWNEEAEKVFGWKKEEVLGRSMAFTIVPTQFRDACLAGEARYIVTGKAPLMNRRVETVAMHRSGRQFPVELTVTEVKNSGATRFKGVMREIAGRADSP